MDVLLDWFFALFHASLALFNLTGWAWRATRRAQLVTISLTLLSWFGLGIFFGWGYCPCTEWHWQVKRRLGEHDLPNSYIKYYADRITGTDWNPLLVDSVTVVLALSAFGLSCWLNWRDWKRRRHRRFEEAGVVES